MEQPIHVLLATARPPHDSAGDDESVVSDCESGVSSGHVPGKLIREAEVVGADFIRSRFIGGLGFHGLKAESVSIHRNACSTVMTQARVQSFQIFARAVAKLRGGTANVRHAWYGASSKEEIADIIQHGFGHAHSHGLRLSSDDSPLERYAPIELFNYN